MTIETAKELASTITSIELDLVEKASKDKTFKTQWTPTMKAYRLIKSLGESR